MSRRGLTVVEVLVAVAIFASAIVVLLAVFPMSTRAARQSQAQLVATHLVQRELEISRNYGFDQLQSRTPPALSISKDHNGVEVTIEYQLQVLVEETRPGLKHVKVEAIWFAPDENERRFSLETDVAKLTP